jgi:hypothetical protein
MRMKKNPTLKGSHLNVEYATPSGSGFFFDMKPGAALSLAPGYYV